MQKTERQKTKVSHAIAGLLFGIGMAMGFIPIFLASLLVKRNLFIEAIDRMDAFWKSLEYQANQPD